MDGYRIFYHEAALAVGHDGSNNAANSDSNDSISSNSSISSYNLGSEVKRIDIKDTNVIIDGLKKNVLYELVVKAGNSFG